MLTTNLNKTCNDGMTSLENSSRSYELKSKPDLAWSVENLKGQDDAHFDCPHELAAQ